MMNLRSNLIVVQFGLRSRDLSLRLKGGFAQDDKGV
jgi:hypothetical protein